MCRNNTFSTRQSARSWNPFDVARRNNVKPSVSPRAASAADSEAIGAGHFGVIIENVLAQPEMEKRRSPLV